MNRQPLRPLPVLFVSGLLGFGVGMFRFPTWQVAVETAQVVARIVKYPAGNPFYIYHTKLWTLLHQVCALFLLAGVSEITLSKALSGVLGMASFQALAMVVYALSGDALAAVVVPFVIFLGRAADYGVVYPVMLLGTDHTYGSLGLSVVVLVAGLYAAGCERTAAFLLGMTPAIHPSLGLFLWLAAGLTLAWHRQINRQAFRYCLAGCGVTAVSLFIQLTVIYDVPHVDSSISQRYVHAFAAFWDAHRGVVNPRHSGVLLNAGALALATFWLSVVPDDLPQSAKFLLRLIVVSSAIAFLCAVISWIPTDSMPVVLLMLMPARTLNFNVMTYVALLFGLLAAYQEIVWAQLLTLVLASGLLANRTSMLWDSLEWIGFPPSVQRVRSEPLVAAVTVGLLLLVLATRNRRRQAGSVPRKTGAGMVRFATLAVFGTAVGLTLTLPFPRGPFLDRTNDPFYAAVAAEPRGLLLTSGTFHLVQLYTRRPVLLDTGALDSLPYAPESGPEMVRILRDVYQIDLFHPPIQVKSASAIPHSLNRPVWQRYSRDKWREIGREYNVTQVLSRSDYNLDLPLAASTPSLRLYRIPQ